LGWFGKKPIIRPTNPVGPAELSVIVFNIRLTFFN